MVEVAVKTQTKEVSPRKQRQIDRLARVNANRPKPVRVLPANDDLRRVLRHPNGMSFRPEGSIEWPNDTFTKRRIADGSVTVEEAKPNEEPKQEDQPVQHRRGHREEPTSNNSAA